LIVDSLGQRRSGAYDTDSSIGASCTERSGRQCQGGLEVSESLEK